MKMGIGKECKRHFGSVIAMAIMVAAASPAMAAVTYSIDQIADLLDADYYAGVAKNGVEASNAGRGAYAPASNFQGTQVAFFGLNIETNGLDIYIVDIGDTASWRRVAPDGVSGTQSGVVLPMTFTFSGNFIWVNGQRLETATGEGAGEPYDFDGNPENGLLQMYSPHGAVLNDGRNIGGGIFRQGVFPPLGDNVHAWRDLTDDSDQIPESLNGWITFFLEGAGIVIDSAMYSPDGTMMTLTIREHSGATPGSDPDEMSVYVLHGVQDIMDSGIGANQMYNTAVTSLADPRLKLIRGVAGAGNLDGFEGSAKVVPLISQDNSLVVWSEEFNNAYASVDQGASALITDWDPMLGNTDNTTADGANSDNDVRYASGTDNALITGSTPGGLRIVLYSDEGQANLLFARAYIATFKAENSVPQTPPETTDTVITDSNGDPFTVPDDSTTDTVQVTVPTVVEDPAGTEILLPPNQVIVFPEGESTISILTPTNPVEEAEIPPVEELVLPVGITAEQVTDLAIPILRTFGPPDTQFQPAVEVTINYTDAEVANLADESQLLPILFNEGTGLFDIILPADAVTFRDTDANIIKFTVDHFSTYGLGAPAAMGAPQSDTSHVLLIVLLALAGAGYLARVYMKQSIRKS